jgi:pyruvate dehydrogenase kinase 2/3/4
MHTLPFVVGVNPHIQSVLRLYEELYDRLLKWPTIETAADEEKTSTELFSLLLRSGRQVPSLLAQASTGIKRHLTAEQLQELLDNMLHTRISRRLLLEHHLSLHNNFCQKPVGVPRPTTVTTTKPIVHAFSSRSSFARATVGRRCST